MRLFRTLNSLVVSRNLWLILLSKIWLFFKFSQTHIKKNSRDSKSAHIFPLALVVGEFLAALWFFTKLKLRNISGTHAATWWQKLGFWFPSLCCSTQGVSTASTVQAVTCYCHLWKKALMAIDQILTLAISKRHISRLQKVWKLL